MTEEYVSLLRLMNEIIEFGTNKRSYGKMTFSVAKIVYLSYTGYSSISWPVSKAIEFLTKSSKVRNVAAQIMESLKGKLRAKL
jgi:hypothetical protein